MNHARKITLKKCTHLLIAKVIAVEVMHMHVPKSCTLKTVNNKNVAVWEHACNKYESKLITFSAAKQSIVGSKTTITTAIFAHKTM